MYFDDLEVGMSVPKISSEPITACWRCSSMPLAECTA